jgi:epsin
MKEIMYGLLFDHNTVLYRPKIDPKVGPSDRTRVSETERKIDEALSNKKWGASSTLFNEIAQITYD